VSEQNAQGIGFFEKYLTVWVILCMGGRNSDREVPARYPGGLGKAAID